MKGSNDYDDEKDDWDADEWEVLFFWEGPDELEHERLVLERAEREQEAWFESPDWPDGPDCRKRCPASRFDARAVSRIA